MNASTTFTLSSLESEGLGPFEVKALFATLGTMPGAANSLREAYGRVKNRLSPAARVAYHRELARLLAREGIAPESLSELLDGEYLLSLRCDAGREATTTLHVREGRASLSLRVCEPELCCLALEVAEDGRLEARLSRLDALGDVDARLAGALEIRSGFLTLQVRVEGRCGGRGFRRELTGTGDARRLLS